MEVESENNENSQSENTGNMFNFAPNGGGQSGNDLVNIDNNTNVNNNISPNFATGNLFSNIASSNSQDEYTEMTGTSQNSNPGSSIEITTKEAINEEKTQVQGNAGPYPFPKKYWEKGRDRMLKHIEGNSVIKSLDPNGNGRATTRSSAKGVITWSALNENLSKACKIAACTVVCVQGGDPMPSPFAPTVGSTAGNTDPSLYLKVTWQSIAHLFSYYMDGTEGNVNKILDKINGDEDEMGEEENIVGVANIAEAQKGIAEEDLENGQEELEIADCSDEITSSRKEWPAMPKFTKGKIVYIPIAFLHALADKEEHPWLKLESMRGAPRDGLILKNEAFKFAKSVKLFTKADDSRRNPSFKRQVGSLWVALRDGNGHLIFCLHDSSWSWKTYQKANCLKIAWKAALGAITPPSRASGGKPPRYQVVPVGDLKIKITALGEARWRDRGGAQALFKTFIDEINKNKEANHGTVSLYTGDGVPANHRLLSEDPFGLYRTYISFEGYNSYMNFLLLGAVPENKEVETYKSLREITDTRALPKNLETSIKLEKKKEGEMEIENGNQDQKAKIIPLNRMRINQDKMKDRDKMDTNGARNNGRDAIKKGDTKGKVHERSSGDIQTLTLVNVNARKIVLAKGQRKSEARQQGTVMAASAPDTARQLFNWQWIDPKVRMGDLTKRESAYKSNEMLNGLYIAEWLHLSAYSWGGLADVQPNATVGEAGSSQVHQNFVLGTSETNSVMTRWEQAWQNLIEHEGDLLTAEGKDDRDGRAYGGQFTIVRHPFRKLNQLNPPKTESKPDQNKEAPSTETRDSGFKKTKLSEPQDNGDKDKQKPNFQIPPKSGTTQFASFLHDVAHAPAGGKPGIQWAPESTVLDVNLQRVAKEFRWVCYQFDYDLYINAPSKILGRNSFSGRARFYPFRRMLYHKIERDLDAKVWKDMLSEVLKKGSKEDPKA